MSVYPLWKPATKDLPVLWDDPYFRKNAEMLAKAVADTGTTSPIVPQQLSPEVIPVFVNRFPLYDLLRKEPSNGVSHTFQQWVGFTGQDDPHFVAENGTVNDDTNQYMRKTTNIAVLAERRGVSIKAQAAGIASGAPASDLMGDELKGGILTIARDVQKTAFRYQENDNSSTTTTAANGKYNQEGFNGLRYVLNNFSPSANTVPVDISGGTWTDQRVILGLRKVANAIWDAGGEVDLILGTSTSGEALFEDQMDLVRYADKTIEITPGRTVRQISTNQGLVPFLPIQGDAVGTYTISGHTYQDIYVLWTENVTLPYLGAPTPSVIYVPTGADGSLRYLAIPFLMIGLACKTPQYLGRVQLKLT